MKHDEIKFNFSAKYIKALFEFKAKQDVRYYLNGFNIKPHPKKQGVILTATDGHSLVSVYDITGYSDGEYIIPISPALKTACNKKLVNDVAYDGKRIGVIIGSWSDRIELSSDDIVYAEYLEPIDGNYPDFEIVFKEDINPISQIPVKPELLARASKAVKDLRHGIILHTTREDGVLMASSGSTNEIAMAFMPMRYDHEKEPVGWLACLMKEGKKISAKKEKERKKKQQEAQQ